MEEYRHKCKPPPGFSCCNFTAISITAVRGRNGSRLKSLNCCMPNRGSVVKMVLCAIEAAVYGLLLLKQSCHSTTQRVKTRIFLAGAYRYRSNNNTIFYRATIESLGHGSHPCHWQTVLIEDCTAINPVQIILGVFRVESLFIRVS